MAFATGDEPCAAGDGFDGHQVGFGLHGFGGDHIKVVSVKIREMDFGAHDQIHAIAKFGQASTVKIASQKLVDIVNVARVKRLDVP